VSTLAQHTADARRSARRRREAFAAYLLIAPDVLGLLLFIGLPMCLALGIAFFEVDGFGAYQFVGFDNFAKMAGDAMLSRSAGVTLGYVSGFVPLAFAVSLGLALLVREPFPGVRFVRMAFFLPNVISLVVAGVLWQFLLVDKRGAVPALLRPIGLGDVSWLGDPRFALASLVLISAWFLVGYQMLIFLAALNDIPREYYDASKVDGATPWQQFRYVTWPMLRPTSLFVAIHSSVGAVTGLQAFDLVYVLTRGGPANSTSTLIFYIYQQAFTYNHYGYAAAMTTMVVAFLAAVTGLMFALTRGGRFDAGDR